MIPSPPQKYFPDILRTYSSVCRELDDDNNKDKKILIVNQIREAEDIVSKLRLYNQGLPFERDIVLLNNPQRDVLSREGVKIRSVGNHWDIIEASTNGESALNKTEILGEGYCGLITAIVASQKFNPEFQVDNYIQDSESGVKDLKAEIYQQAREGNYQQILAICPEGEANDKVLSLMSNNAASETWLEDRAMIDIINHNCTEEKKPLEIQAPIFKRSVFFERKIAFLKHLNDQVTNISSYNSNQDLGISLEDLFFDKSHEPSAKDLYDVQETKLGIEVLNKFNDEEESDDKKNKYNLFYQLIKNIEDKQDLGDLRQDEKDVIHLQIHTIKQRMEEHEYLTEREGGDKKDEDTISEIDKNKKLFLTEINRQDINYADFFMRQGCLAFEENDPLTFRGAILDLAERSDAWENYNIKKIYQTLFTDDTAKFCTAITPDYYQPKPLGIFKGWGLEAVFKGTDLTIEGKKVEQIFDNEGRDILAELKEEKFVKDNPELFAYAVTYFFRKEEGNIDIVYSGGEKKNLSSLDKKNWQIDKEGNPQEVKKEIPDIVIDNIDTEEYFKKRFEAYCNSPTKAPEEIPDLYQPMPKGPFEGWGLEAVFKGMDLKIEGNKVEKILNAKGEDILARIKKTSNDHQSFTREIVAFFRKDQGNITLKYNNGDPDRILFEKDRRVINEAPPPPAGPSLVPPPAPQPPAEAKGGEKAPQTDQEKKEEEIFKAFTDHIDSRFTLLNKLLKEDPNKIAIIPGSIQKDGNIFCAFANGLAVDQWIKQCCGGNKDRGEKMAEACRQHFTDKSTELLGKYKDRVLFGNVGMQKSDKFLPQFPVGGGVASYNALFNNNDTGDEDKLILQYESLCKQAKTKDTVKDNTAFTNGEKIKAYQAKLFGKDGALADKTFIHVWGANVKNFNNTKGNYKGGGGQAAAFNDQVLGVFGICSTPHLYKHDIDYNALMATCKTHDTPSKNPASPRVRGRAPIIADAIGHA